MAGANAGVPAPPPRPPPPARSNTFPGSTPSRPLSNVNDALAAEIKQGKALNKIDHGTVHPDLPGIRTRRDNLPPHVFADFTRDSRVSTHKLMEGPVGKQTLTDLDSSTGRLNPGATGTTKQPLTAVDIHASNMMGQAVRPQANPATAQALDNLPPGDPRTARLEQQFKSELVESRNSAYRAGGQPGAGAPSKVTYYPNAGKTEANEPTKNVGDHRANSLGHEMVHAWRASNGLQVNNVNNANLGSHPAFQNADAAKPGGGQHLKEGLNMHTRMKEEFETVGLQPTPGRPNAPSENKIRNELGMKQRQDYSEWTPQTNADHLTAMKEQPDNRNSWAKLSGKPIPGAEQRASDVQQIVNHLEK